MRQVEQTVQKLSRAPESKPEAVAKIIEKGKGKGRIEIDYHSQDDLDRIYTQIAGEAPV